MKCPSSSTTPHITYKSIISTSRKVSFPPNNKDFILFLLSPFIFFPPLFSSVIFPQKPCFFSLFYLQSINTWYNKQFIKIQHILLIDPCFQNQILMVGSEIGRLPPQFGDASKVINQSIKMNMYFNDRDHISWHTCLPSLQEKTLQV